VEAFKAVLKDAATNANLGIAFETLFIQRPSKSTSFAKACRNNQTECLLVVFIGGNSMATYNISVGDTSNLSSTIYCGPLNPDLVLKETRASKSQLSNFAQKEIGLVAHIFTEQYNASVMEGGIFIDMFCGSGAFAS
jgi:hypothetical protein